MHDPSLTDLPYKVELNAWGKIEMSPAGNRHGRLQAVIVGEFARQLPRGIVLSECSILTKIGIRVPDVAWGGPEFMKAWGEITPYRRAPEICVEIVSPSNSKAEMQEKTEAYLSAGAVEVWLVSEEGTIRYFTASGEAPGTAFSVRLSLPAPIK